MKCAGHSDETDLKQKQADTSHTYRYMWLTERKTKELQNKVSCLSLNIRLFASVYFLHELPRYDKPDT